MPCLNVIISTEYKRPIVWALIFLVFGILGSWGLSSNFDSDLYLNPVLLVGFIVVVFAGCLALYFWIKYPPIFLCLFFALAGFFGTLQSLGNGVLFAENVEFIGIVQDLRYTRTGWQRLVVLADDGIDDGELSLARPGARVLAFLSPEYRVEIGQSVRLRGDLFPLEKPRNPGGYNEFMVQRAHGIAGRFNAREAETYEIHMNLARFTYRIRNLMINVYEQVLPHREAGIIQSIVLGIRPDMDDPVIEMYRMSGIYHLLVVSGLHLSILMMAACLLLERVFNKRTAGLAALALMIGYTILTGAGISTIRAVTMAGVAVFGRVLYRDRDALASVSFACILLLLIEPLYLFSIGFQLSFGTVFGLILLNGPTERALALLGMPSYGKFRSILAYNIMASVSTYPILAYHFNYLSAYSIFVNLIIAPTVTLLVIVGLLTGLTGLVSMGLAAFLAGVVYYILQFYEAVIRWWLAFPGSVLLVGNWGLLVTLLSLAVMLAFGFAFSGYGLEFSKRIKVFYLSVVVLLACIGFEALDRRRFHITALDINSYVARAGGSTFVIDGGGNNRLLGMNTGIMVLMPYLDYRGVNKADAVFVTDASRQRITGLIELAMADRVGVLYVSMGLDMDSGLGMRLRVEAERNGVPVYRLQTGDIIRSGRLKAVVVEEHPRLLVEVSEDERFKE